MNDIEWHFACWESPQGSTITSNVNQRGCPAARKEDNALRLNKGVCTEFPSLQQKHLKTISIDFRVQEDLQSQLSHSVRLYWLREIQGLIHSTPLRQTHPAPVLRNLVLKWSSATVSLALLLLLLVPVRHLLQEFVPAKALGCIQRTRMSPASKMLRICEKGCWLECKWVASNVPSQAIVAMIRNVYNMCTNYSVHASHTTCMHLWHLPNTTYHPSLISTASALDGSVSFISTRSTVSGSTSVPWLIMERKLEKHPAMVFWCFLRTQNGARSRPENPWWTFRVHNISVSSTTKISKTRRDVWKYLGDETSGYVALWGFKNVKQLAGNDPSLSPKLSNHSRLHPNLICDAILDYLIKCVRVPTNVEHHPDVSIVVAKSNWICAKPRICS